MLNIFSGNWMDTPILNDGERMLRILTGNPMDDLYVIVGDSMDEDDLESEIRFALRHKYGKRGSNLYRGYEDASYICQEAEEIGDTVDEGWDGEGYYIIGWSDGGDWTNDGPVWFDTKADLQSEVECAYNDKTDTHLPYAEKVKQFEQYELDALLGDFKDDFDVDAIIEIATKVCADGNRYWVVEGDELTEIIKDCEK